MASETGHTEFSTAFRHKANPSDSTRMANGVLSFEQPRNGLFANPLSFAGTQGVNPVIANMKGRAIGSSRRGTPGNVTMGWRQLEHHSHQSPETLA
jgi:hypothetical protein